MFGFAPNNCFFLGKGTFRCRGGGFLPVVVAAAAVLCVLQLSPCRLQWSAALIINVSCCGCVRNTIVFCS